MTKITIKISTLTLALLLTSCAGSLGWGKHYEVAFANTKSITINYDSLLTDLSELGPVAQAHCKKYDKEAVPQPQADKAGIRTITFLCE